MARDPSSQITHDGATGRQIVSADELRAVLRSHGERCYCRPRGRDGRGLEWDVGPAGCPVHGGVEGEV